MPLFRSERMFTPLLPTDTTLGGTSQVNSINANYVVAGSGSIAASTALTASEAACVDETTRGDQPIEACNRNIILATSGITRTRRAGLWLQRAHVWSLDVEGTVVSTQTYGTLITDEEPDLQGSSQALDVNKQRDFCWCCEYKSGGWHCSNGRLRLCFCRMERWYKS